MRRRWLYNKGSEEGLVQVAFRRNTAILTCTRDAWRTYYTVNLPASMGFLDICRSNPNIQTVI